MGRVLLLEADDLSYERVPLGLNKALVDILDRRQAVGRQIGHVHASKSVELLAPCQVVGHVACQQAL